MRDRDYIIIIVRGQPVLMMRKKSDGMRFAKNLYTTEKTRDKLSRIKHRLKWRKSLTGTYVISIASNEENLLDISHGNLYLQKYYRKLHPDIVGAAENYDAAVELVVQILMDARTSELDFPVQTYFKF